MGVVVQVLMVDDIVVVMLVVSVVRVVDFQVGVVMACLSISQVYDV